MESIKRLVGGREQSRAEGEARAAEQNEGRRSNSLKSIKRQERKSLDYQTGDTLPFCASLAAPQIYGQKCVRKRNNNKNNKNKKTTTLVVLELVFSYCFFTFWQDLGYKDCHRANCRERQLQMIYRQIVEFKSETQKERKGNGNSDGDDDGNFCSAHKYLFIKLLSLPAKYPDPSRQTLLPALPLPARPLLALFCFRFLPPFDGIVFASLSSPLSVFLQFLCLCSLPGIRSFSNRILSTECHSCANILSLASAHRIMATFTSPSCSHSKFSFFSSPGPLSRTLSLSLFLILSWS